MSSPPFSFRIIFIIDAKIHKKGRFFINVAKKRCKNALNVDKFLLLHPIWKILPHCNSATLDTTARRQEQQQRLKDNKTYQAMSLLTRYMDRYYLDALIGLVPGWGDAFALLSIIPFVYFSVRVVRSVPLTLAVINNSLRDVLLGMIPFFVGDIIDIFHRSNTRNFEMIQGFVDGDEGVIRQVNQRALQSAVAIVVLLLLIGLVLWLLIRFGSFLYSQALALF